MARPVPALASACLLALMACTRPAEPSGPVPLAVTPAQGAPGAPVPVEIAGRDFEARVRSDFEGSGSDALDARFTARLEPEAGPAVELEAVTFTERRTLLAVVPAGISRGLHRLVVTDPRGRSGTLEQAYRVVASTESVASFRVAVLEPPRAGVPFGVALTALDAGGEVVDGYTGTVAMSDLTGSLSPASAGPFVLGHFQGQATIPVLAAADELAVSDGAGRSGTSAPFDVVAGPPIAVVFPDPPVTAAAGTCSPAVEVELRDRLGNVSPAGADVAAQLQSSPPGLAFFSDATCTTPASSLVVGAGTSQAAFHFRAAAPGPVTIRVLPASLPGAVQAVTVSP